MKLMELLEQGKKATRKDIEKCLYVDVDGSDIEIFKICDNNKNGYNPSFEDLTRNDWYEYEEYKNNFEFEDNQKCYFIGSEGDIMEGSYRNCGYDKVYMNNFNQFPNEELAEFIQKKQLLERKLMAFSYLNGASEIDWENEEYCYYIDIDSKYSSDIDIEVGTSIESFAKYNELCNFYFKDRKTCEKALELYEDEMKEVMEMKIKLGF